jgi:N-acetyl-anhydromuramyl-L-alanine amidase AmpD
MARILPVRRPYERVKMNVVNQSSRNGDTPQLIVIHDTESLNHLGDADLKAIGAWFDNPKAQASAHVCVDAEGRSAQYVPDDRKAWHVAWFNSRSLGIEQIGVATQTFWPEAQVKKAAKYVAYWSKKYGIPIDAEHVVTHASLGAAGGGHHDPGSAYPMEKLRYHARYYRRTGWIH